MSEPVTPHVFVSAGSQDLRSARKVINDALNEIGCLPIEQSVFGTQWGTVRDMLIRRMEPCQAVIHLVGPVYGSEPDPETLPDGQPRRSWTQMECDLALEMKKRLYYIVCDSSYPFDKPPAPEPEENAARQEEHRQAVLSGDNLWYVVHNEDELHQAIERLKLPFEELRAEILRGQRRHRWRIRIGAAALAILLIGAIFILRELRKDVGQTGGKVAEVDRKVTRVSTEIRQLSDPVALAASLRKQIISAAESKITRIPQGEGRWRRIAEVEKERDLQLERVDDLVQLVRDGLRDEPTPGFQRAVAILENGGIQESLAYLEARRSETLKGIGQPEGRSEAERHRRNSQLKSLVLEAELHVSRLDWDAARTLATDLVRHAPNLFEGQRILGSTLLRLDRSNEAEPHLRAALKLARSSWQKAVVSSDLGEVLQRTNRLREADRLYRQALLLYEKNLTPDHPEVAGRLTDLGSLVAETHGFHTAEPLFRRAVEIYQKALGTQNQSCFNALDNLARSLREQGYLAEAEALSRHTLPRWENVGGTEHPRVAQWLSDFAQLQFQMERYFLVELLLRRALSIRLKQMGADHPDVAVDLDKLATMLVKATNDWKEAEGLYRRALEITESSLGSDHPRVAVTCLNLGLLLKKTKRSIEAEALYRHGLDLHRQTQAKASHSLAGLLSSLGSLYLENEHPVEGLSLVRHSIATLEQVGGIENASRLAAIFDYVGKQYLNRQPEAAEILLRRCLILTKRHETKTGKAPGGVGKRFQHYQQALEAMGAPKSEIEGRTREAMSQQEALQPIARELDKLLGPPLSVAEVYRRIDQKYQQKGKPDVTFLPRGKLITPLLNKRLERAMPIENVFKRRDDVYRQENRPRLYFHPMDKPFAPELERIFKSFGPLQSVSEILRKIDSERDREGTSTIWRLPLNKPIHPHLTDLLGPTKEP